MIRRVSQELSSSPDLDRSKLGLSEASGMRATMKGVRLQALAFGKEACKTLRSTKYGVPIGPTPDPPMVMYTARVLCTVTLLTESASSH